VVDRRNTALSKIYLVRAYSCCALMRNAPYGAVRFLGHDK
jgi:hypothetical protein